jgi:hypothetical protein
MPENILGRWKIKHPDWSSFVDFLPNGTFSVFSPRIVGQWSLTNTNFLTLKLKNSEEYSWVENEKMTGRITGIKIIKENLPSSFAPPTKPMPFLLAGTIPYAALITNAVKHLLQYVPLEDVKVAAPDHETADVFKASIPCSVFVVEDTLPKDEQYYRNKKWGSIVRWKLKTIHASLSSSDLLYIDPDVIVFDDIRNFLPPGNWDVCAQRNYKYNMCMGIVAVKSSHFSKKLLSPPVEEINSDEEYIGSMWDYANSKLMFFNFEMFPTGSEPLQKPPAVCYHYNFSIGTQEKIARMTKDGTWLLP